MRHAMGLAGVGLWLLAAQGQAPTKGDQAQAKKPQEILNLTPEKFIERFDKDKDGLLSKDEAPPFLAKAFDRFDRNGDGKLNRDEVAAMLPVLRKNFAAGPGPLGKTPEQIVENLLKFMDADRDGKISRAEAKGRIAETFDKVDTNKDGFLDRGELRVMAQRILANLGGAGIANANDFDALDKNADGRLTAAELKGTPWSTRFAEIDTDGNGSIDRREFQNFLRRGDSGKKE